MLPTITPKVENENPKFADLYSRLTVDLLNPDGTTRNRPVREVEEDEALERDLRSYSALLAKDELLLNALREVQLPDGLQEILDLHLAALESNKRPPISLPVLDEVLEALPPLLKQHIELPPHSLLQLPANTPPSLAPYTIATRLAGVQNSRLSLHARRSELANLLTEVCDLYEEHIRSMGDVIGKSGYIEKVGKMLEAKSSFLKGVAEGTEGKAGIFKYEILKAIYDEKAIEALENYRMHLIDTKSRLVAKKRQVQDDLKKYESAGDDMKVLVEKYGQILKTSEQVRADIKRLGGKPLC